MIDRLKAEENAAKPTPSCTLVILGITGDLVHRLLMPALYSLAPLATAELGGRLESQGNS